MDLIHWFTAPLQHEFMLKAILMSGLVGLVCSALSCFMTLKGWALMGDAVSHAVMPGVVIAYALNLPLALGAFVFGVGAVAAIGFIKAKTRIKEDTVIGWDDPYTGWMENFTKLYNNNGTWTYQKPFPFMNYEHYNIRFGDDRFPVEKIGNVFQTPELLEK
jgi:hypothetical protein